MQRKHTSQRTSSFLTHTQTRAARRDLYHDTNRRCQSRVTARRENGLVEWRRNRTNLRIAGCALITSNAMKTTRKDTQKTPSAMGLCMQVGEPGTGIRKCADAYTSATLPAHVTSATTKAIRRVDIRECGGRDKRGLFSLRRREDTAN
jgi:hypothetical protein